MASMSNPKDRFVVTAFWETKPGEEEAVAKLLSRFAPQAREEPGVESFVIREALAKLAKRERAQYSILR
jgi:quinol monooxygenase YgiN